ncbi:HK97 family phage prohead protease [Chenggangzhangella methanolivorans]|uniref:HK97 family phage prohead protease n=1 Tax=Chenggangzhangella methanolivorans TaxID=1437009 RepID=A0A9E6RBD4_9HYPH|nr:HK97 family phage prohead protease [Chenggangzhangella methanolivorans]QZO01658.1 HK97 family phage prohead protease [Chenggangzhangella methanolivorans]
MPESEARFLSSPLPASEHRLAGYAARFNERANIDGEYIEVIAPGAFAQSLKANDQLALLHHFNVAIIGRKSSGTLRLREDAVGLAVEIDLDPSTPDGATALGLVRRGDLRGMSFGFWVRSESWEEPKWPALPVRTLHEVRLTEVSIVAYPAYGGTSIGLASQTTGAASPGYRARLARLEAAEKAIGRPSR